MQKTRSTVYFANAWKKIKTQKYLLLMLLPTFIILGIFNYGPMYGAIIAFKNYNPRLGIIGSPWTGLDHFRKLWGNMFFQRIFSNTISISLLHLLWGFPAPIILALMLNEIKQIKFKRTVQTITYLPHFLSWVIIGGFLLSLLSPTRGLVKSLSYVFGFNYDRAILAEPAYFRSILVTSGIWQGVGWGSIIYLASMAGINAELYEAAEIDGANRFRKMLNITLPGISSTIAVLLILRVGGIMNSNFEQIFLLYTPATYRVADVFSTYIYREGLLKANFSYTTAIGLFQSSINFFLIVATNWICRKLGRAMW